MKETASVDALYDFTYLGATGSTGQYWQQLSQRFSERHGITLTLTETPYDDLTTRVQAAHAAQQGPDIMSQFPNGDMAAAAFNGSFVPLDDLVGGEEQFKDWLFLAPGSVLNDRHYLAPMLPELNILVANRDHLSAAGVSPDERAPDWESFVESLDKIKSSGQVPITLGSADVFNIFRWTAAMGNVWLDSVTEVMDFTLGDLSATDPKIGNWLKQLAQLRDGEYINNDAADITDQQVFDRFRQGEGAMAMLGGGRALQLIREGPFVLLPVWDGPGRLSPQASGAGVGYCVTSYGGDAEAAGELIKFWNEPEQLTLFFETTGELPANAQFDVNAADAAVRDLWGIATAEPIFGWQDYLGAGSLDIPFALQAEILASDMDPTQAIEQYDQGLEQWRQDNPQALEATRRLKDAL